MATQNEGTEDMNARRIVGSVSQGGRMYVAGQEDALAGVVSQKNLDRLADKGVLAGDWSTSSRVEGGEPAAVSKAPEAPATEPAAKPATKTAAKTARKSVGKSTSKKRGR